MGICSSRVKKYSEDAKDFMPEIDEGMVISVYDGDTFTIIAFPKNVIGCYKFHVRLAGIDTAEMKSKSDIEKEKAQISKKFLQEHIDNRIVRLENVKKEKYGRLLADVYLDSVHINKLMLEKGGAVEYDGKKKTTVW